MAERDTLRVAAARLRKPRARWASPLDLAVALDPSTRRTPALELLNDALVDVAEGRCKRLALSISPQEGKTSLLQWFVLWLMTFRPDGRSAVVSYEQDIATRSGRRIRDLIAQHDGTDGLVDLGLRVRRGDHSAARWTLDGHIGGLVCAGVGGALTGRAVDGALIVDDAHKNFEAAMSSASRAAVFEWFRSVALTRLSPDAAVIVCGTRWHHQDLIGRLVKDQPGSWRVINVPAVADSPDDPLGRAAGEGMASVRGDRDWPAIEREAGSYLWNAMYQGRPSPAAGGVFQTDKIKYWTPAQGPSGELVLDLAGRRMPLELCWTVATADLAASTKSSADFTVILAVAITPERDLVVLDMVRRRMSPAEHFEAARPLLQRWKCHTLYIEAAMNATSLSYDAARAGVPIAPLKPDADKVTRALPAAARMEQGRVWLPAGAAWVQDFVDELAAFPAGAHDDICDALAYSARLDSAHYSPPLTAQEELDLRRSSRPDEFDRAMSSAFGPEMDVFGVQW